MTDDSQSHDRHIRFSIRRMFGIVAAFAFGFSPIPYFGLAGILPSVVLIIFCLLIVARKYQLSIAFVGLLLLLGFLLPVFQGARPAALRMKCGNNLRDIVIAIHDYESVHGHLPPPYTISDTGVPLHSWRVLLLPYLGNQELFDQIDLTKPWDDPVNLSCHDLIPDVYRCAAVRLQSKWRTTEDTTNYIAVVGERTAWPIEGTRTFNEISDGLSATIAVMESEAHRLPWMSPTDPTLEAFVQVAAAESPDRIQNPHEDSPGFAFFDKQSRRQWKPMSEDNLKAMFLIDDQSDQR